MNIRGMVTHHVDSRYMPVGSSVYALQDISEIARERALAKTEDIRLNHIIANNPTKTFHPPKFPLDHVRRN